MTSVTRSQTKKVARRKGQTGVLLAAVAVAAAVAAGAVDAATYSWTRPQAVRAVKAAPIWKNSPPLPGKVSPLRVTAVTKLAAAGPGRWNMTVVLANHVPAAVITPSQTVPAHTVVTKERFCVTALSGFKAAQTVFRIDGWAYNTVNGGCSHVGQFDSGGSAAYRP